MEVKVMLKVNGKHQTVNCSLCCYYTNPYYTRGNILAFFSLNDHYVSRQTFGLGR